MADKFEYQVAYMPTSMTSNDPELISIEKQLKNFGSKGWELVQILVDSRVIIYKRKIETAIDISNKELISRSK
jgi:uncharacterized protein DUF4177